MQELKLIHVSKGGPVDNATFLYDVSGAIGIIYEQRSDWKRIRALTCYTFAPNAAEISKLCWIKKINDVDMKREKVNDWFRSAQLISYLSPRVCL